MNSDYTLLDRLQICASLMFLSLCALVIPHYVTTQLFEKDKKTP